MIQPLAKAFGRLQQATGHIARVGMANPDEAGAAAVEYLKLFGLVALGYMWARMAETAMPKSQSGDEQEFYRAKLATARFYMERVLPENSSLFAQIMAGSGTMMEFEDAAF